ncbi:MAG: EAL domain-containing protein [Pseudomonadota bacterium]
MGRNSKKWANLPAGQHNPLAYAVTARDQSVLQMVDDAVRHKNVMLAYQSVVPSGQQDTPAFYEGLIRVLDDAGRVIPAGEFIEAVETQETGRLIDCLALEKGLRALLKYPGLRLSINMSARSIGYARWMRSLKRGLSQDDTIAERLILEISEASAMLVPELVTSFMADLHGEGISFALDDFGAGFTSFKHLQKFHFDILKVDGQYVRGIAEDGNKQVMVAAFVAIAQQMDLITVAESVENPNDAHVLLEMGVDCLQGYYFGAPTVHPTWAETDNLKARA